METQGGAKVGPQLCTGEPLLSPHPVLRALQYNGAGPEGWRPGHKFLEECELGGSIALRQTKDAFSGVTLLWETNPSPGSHRPIPILGHIQ